MKTRLYCFDFDGCLMDSPLPDPGKQEYERLTGEAYPHKGWWSKHESLHEMFDIKPIEVVHNLYKGLDLSISSPVLITNRLSKLHEDIGYHLKKFDIVFDNYSYGDSYQDLRPKENIGNAKMLGDKVYRRPKGKSSRLAPMIEKFNGEDNKLIELFLFDDMDEHINGYIEMREDWKLWGSPIKVKIFQVVNNELIEK